MIGKKFTNLQVQSPGKNPGWRPWARELLGRDSKLPSNPLKGLGNIRSWV